MDTTKTGALIRQLRREQNLTQKDLAQQLHLTDRAVSKWERGLCAPDIATLEPLSRALGVTVTEIITGERMQNRGEDFRAVIGYSVEKTVQERRTRRKYLLLALTLIGLAVIMATALLWAKGVFSLAARSVSPDGEAEVTVYNCDMTDRFSAEPHLTVYETRLDGTSYTTIYGGIFAGLWWSPAGGRYILTMETAEGPRTVLVGPNVTEVDAWLRLIVGEAGLDFDSAETQYRFCQWAADGDYMLIRYICGDGTGGYFWCSCDTGTVAGLLELPPA